MSVPTASAPVLSILGTYSEVRTQATEAESVDGPRSVLAKNLLHNVALTKITLDLPQREFLQFWNVILARDQRSAPVCGGG